MSSSSKKQVEKTDIGEIDYSKMDTCDECGVDLGFPRWVPIKDPIRWAEGRVYIATSGVQLCSKHGREFRKNHPELFFGNTNEDGYVPL